MVGTENSHKSLEKFYAKRSTEILIIVILSIRDLPHQIELQKALETIKMMANLKFKMQTGKIFTERHNHLAGIIYRNICSLYGLDSPKTR